VSGHFLEASADLGIGVGASHDLSQDADAVPVHLDHECDRLVRDLRHRHVGEALLGDERFRAVHQALAGLDAADLLRGADPSELGRRTQSIDFLEK
jgi:hypothetical protein